MAIKKLYQNGINEDGQNTIMDGLSFVRAINNNANELGTNTKLDLETHNTPEFIAKALREQTEISEKTQKIGYQTPGGPDDMPTHEEEGAPVDSPSELKDGLAQIYNKIVETETPIEVKDVASLTDLQQAAATNAGKVSIAGDMSADSSTQFNSSVQIDGGDNTITYSGTGKAVVLIGGGSIKNLEVNNTGSHEDWDSSYGLQVFNNNYEIENVKLYGSNAGMQINAASAKLSGTIDVSNNTFGGINATSSSDKSLPAARLDITNATIINTNESMDIPTIWTDPNSVVIGADKMYIVTDTTRNQIKYYLNEENANALKEKLGINTLSEDEELAEADETLEDPIIEDEVEETANDTEEAISDLSEDITENLDEEE